MKRFALVLALAACSGGQKTTSSPGSAAGSAAIYGKKLQLAWTMSPSETAGSTDVFITSTDETGAAVSHPLGTFPRTCKVAAPAPAMNAVTGVTCGAPDGTRTELHAVSGRDEVILLQLKIDPGSSGDPMARRR